jgi:hypothetical protein
MVLTISSHDLQQARLRGACRKRVEEIQPGMPVSVLRVDDLDWVQSVDLWSIEHARVLAGDGTTVLGVIPAVLFGKRSSYGAVVAAGSGYGDYDNGAVVADGSGYGDYDNGSGGDDGYGYGYGDYDGSGGHDGSGGYGYGSGYGVVADGSGGSIDNE